MFNKRLAVFLTFIFIVVIFRLPIFFLSHLNNDELIHLSLAMKVEKYGLSVFQKQKYNLFYVDRALNSDFSLVGVWEGKDETGLLLHGFLGEKSKLSHHPPLLPFFLSVSHKIFATTPIYLANISRNFELMLRNFTVQFYACIVQFLASLLFILSVFILGSLLFSNRVGLLSALFLSLTPTELVTANKIWADDMTALFVTLAVILYLYSLKHNRTLFSLLAGLSCGLSIITKMSGVYLVFVVVAFHIIENIRYKANIKTFLFDRKILCFILGTLIASGWWFYLYYSNFDISSMKIYFTINEMQDLTRNWSPFFGIVSNRPWFSYFVLVPYQFPLYSLSYIFIILYIFKRRLFREDDRRYLNFLVIWMVTVFIFLTLKPGKELRYMLVGYPAISILSAYFLNLFYGWFKDRELVLDLRSKRILIVGIILLSLIFSLRIALPSILLRADIIPIPL